MLIKEERNFYRRVLRTLRRIPVDIRLELATREFDMFDGQKCLVGTAVRAGLARAQNPATEDVNSDSVYDDPNEAVKLFGGTERRWGEIYSGVMEPDTFPIIERAFTNALLETIPA